MVRTSLYAREVLFADRLTIAREYRVSGSFWARLAPAATPGAALTTTDARITIRTRLNAMARSANVVQLRPETEQAFDAYIRGAETAMEQELRGPHPFLWANAVPERAQQVRGGQIVTQLCAEQGRAKVPNGLIHDWIGAELILGTTIDNTLGLVQNYDQHKAIYKPEVMDSVLISHHGNDFKIRLRLLKKKVLTVVLDTDHDVHYRPVDRKRWVCYSHTTRIAEVENVGGPNEKVLPPDTGHGFLWRLNSYWKFEEKKRRRLRGVSRYFADPRCAVWAGMADRADHPEAPSGIARPHSGSYTLGTSVPRTPLSPLQHHGIIKTNNCL